MSDTPLVELVQVVAGRVLVLLREPDFAAPERVAVAVGACEPRDVRVLLAFAPEGGARLLVLDLDALSDLPLLDAPLRLDVGRGREVLTRVTPVAIDGAGIAPEHATLIGRAADAGAWDAPVAAALRWRLTNRSTHVGPDTGFHYGVPMGGGAAVAGWVANLGDRPLVLLSDGLESARWGSDVAAFPWPDLGDRLAREGRTVVTDRHGFAAALPLLRSGDQGFLVFEVAGDGVVFRTRMSWHPGGHGQPDAALEDSWRYLGRGGDPSPDVARRNFAPLLARRRADVPRADELELTPAQGAPGLSVVVPLFGRPLLLRALLANLHAWPVDAELVLVCDDPDLAPFARGYGRDRAPLVARPARLLSCAANYGFATACNLGAAAARAPVLLFLNSDVRIEDGAALADGVAAVRDGAFGAVGFRLLFEDGTVQHDGMRFERHRGHGDLWLAEHPGKGLPPASSPPGIAPVPAVTGAALMMAADWFRDLGGFDPGYARGDFEDADLCLRSVAAGRPCGVARRGRMVHLERQSIGTGSVRGRALTLLNAVRFNDRWAAQLEAGRCAS